jgi:hypothetical protein
MKKSGKNYISKYELGRITADSGVGKDANDLLLLLEKKENGFSFIDEKLQDVFLIYKNKTVLWDGLSDVKAGKVPKYTMGIKSVD